jgi:hypothetical protein
VVVVDHLAKVVVEVQVVTEHLFLVSLLAAVQLQNQDLQLT